MWWGWNSVQSSPLPFNLTPRASTPLYGELILFFHPRKWRSWKFKASAFPESLGFSGSLGRALKQFRPTGSYLQERRWWELPSLPSWRGSGTSETTKDRGVPRLPLAEVGLLRVPCLRIVSRLKNGLNWPLTLKFTVGSTGAVCSNLGGVSLRKSVILLFLLIETILSLQLRSGRL